jgi:hypothetical protein
MERFCGMLKSALHSQSHPWSNLDKRVLHMSYLGQLDARYNLQAELRRFGKPIDDNLRKNERAYPNCECVPSSFV